MPRPRSKPKSRHCGVRLERAHRILTAGGIWPLTKGHVSARIPGTDHVLILGHIHSEGRSLIDTDIDDIVMVDLDGNWLEGRIEPVDERYLFRMAEYPAYSRIARLTH